MRWLGQMQRAFQLMCSYSLTREAFGEPLARKQTVQNWIADSYAETQACRLMTLDAAHKIDAGPSGGRRVGAVRVRGGIPGAGAPGSGGGPVQPEAFMVVAEFEDIALAAAPIIDRLGFMPADAAPDELPISRLRLFAGYSGW